jgi:ubiquinone/menaquinone biosynthesis C-methylase UbiE
MRRMNAFQIAVEIARNAAAIVLPWRESLDYYTDWKAYGEGLFGTHVEQLSAFGFNVDGKDVLEIGPGSSLWTAYLCRTHGARSVVAIDHRRYLIERNCPDGALDQVKYLSTCNAERTGLQSSSFDLIYSHAVLEHVHSPRLVLSEMWRLLRPGGLISHQIDTRNHLDFSRPMEHLALPEWVWFLMTSSRSSYTNRLTIPMWRNLFAAGGFDVLAAIETGSLQHPDRPDGGLLIRARKPD